MLLLFARPDCYAAGEDAEAYPLWIENVQVTEENKENVLGDGHVSYDPESRTLTLDGATLHTVRMVGEDEEPVTYRDEQWSYLEEEAYAAILAKGFPLSIRLVGENRILPWDGSDAGDYVYRVAGIICAYDWGVLDKEQSACCWIQGEGSLGIRQQGHGARQLLGAFLPGDADIQDARVSIEVEAADLEGGQAKGLQTRNLRMWGKASLDVHMAGAGRDSRVSGVQVSSAYVSTDDGYGNEELSLEGARLMEKATLRVRLDDHPGAYQEAFFGNLQTEGQSTVSLQTGRGLRTRGVETYVYAVGGAPGILFLKEQSRMDIRAGAATEESAVGVHGLLYMTEQARLTVEAEEAPMNFEEGYGVRDSYGILGDIEVYGMSALEARGQGSALRGRTAEADLSQHELPRVLVNEEPMADNARRWKGEQPLALAGEEGFAYRYVRWPEYQSLEHMTALAASCSTKGRREHWQATAEGGTVHYFTDGELETEVSASVVEIPALGHLWDGGKVTKEATAAATGIKTYTCSRCKATKTETIPKKAAPGSDPKQKGSDGTALGPGASAAAAEKAITSAKGDEGPAGSKFSALQMKSPKQTKNSIKLSWKKVPGAKKYVLYGNKCGKGKKYKKIGTYTGTSVNLKKAAGAKLKKGTYYKFMLVALDKNNIVVSTSKTVHVATKGGKVGNHKSVMIKAKLDKNGKAIKSYKTLSSTVLKKGTRLKLKVTTTPVSKKLKVKQHRKICFESSNPKVAGVSKAGVVKAKKKGSCYIYAYAQNGVFQKLKVTVR